MQKYGGKDARKEFEEIIRRACELNLEEYDCKEIITDEERLAAGKRLVPDEYIEKIKADCEERLKNAPESIYIPVEKEKPKENPRIYKFNKKLLFVATLILGLMLGAISVMGIQGVVLNKETVVKSDGVTTTISYQHNFSEEEIEAVLQFEEKNNVKVIYPTYIPKGFSLRDMRVTNNWVRLVYESRNGEKITIKESVLEEGSVGGVTVDATEAVAGTKLIGNRDVTFVYYEQNDTGVKWTDAIWAEENKDTYNVTVCNVSTTLSEEDLVKIVKSMK